MNNTAIVPNPLSLRGTAEDHISGEGLLTLFRKRPKPMSRKELEEMEQELLRQKTKLAQKELELNSRMEAGKIHTISPAQIIPNPDQPRKCFKDASIVSLADSIQHYGILQPLTIRPKEKEAGKFYTQDTVFTLIAGERRLRAAKLLQLESVPCIIIDADSRRSAELALIENLQRENLNLFEQASAIASLIDVYHLTQEQIAKKLSVSQSYVANKLRILRLTGEERDFILEVGLTERHARAFLRITDIDNRKKVIATVARKRMNVAMTEEYIDRFLSDPVTDPSVQKHKVILKDIRLFFNSVERAVSTVKDAGINIVSQREESNDEIRWVITIPKARA